MIPSPSPTPESSIDSIRWEALQAGIAMHSLRRAFDLFRQNGLEPVLIKGWAAAINYPQPSHRSYTDIDLAFSIADYERAEAVRRAGESKGLDLDLHKELKHLDTADFQDLFENSLLVDSAGLMVRTLRPEDHLRVLAVHWLIDAGWFKDRLWDIYYAVENRTVDFDWDRCLDLVSPRRRRWIICVIGLAHSRLGLYIDDLPFADEAKKLPKWFIRAINREWNSDVRLLPLHRFIGSPSEFWQQVKKRIPPNPIHATLDMEGSFDAPTRLHYQIGTFFKRAVPSIQRFATLMSLKKDR